MGVLGFLAVMIGAMGAHALKSHWNEDQMAWLKTAGEYQFYHTFAMLGLLAIGKGANRLLNVAFWFFFAGILLFSGSLYVLAATQVKTWGMVTPLGGVSLMLGWLAVVMAGLSADGS